MQTLRQLLQALVGVAFWVCFGLLWWLLFKEGKLGAQAVRTNVEVVAAIGVAVAIVTLAWVHHNVRIYRRKGPRKGRPTISPRTDVDRLGRRVQWDLPQGHTDALAAGMLVVEVGHGEKRYRKGR